MNHGKFVFIIDPDAPCAGKALMLKAPKLTTMYKTLSLKDVAREGFSNCEFFKTMENSNVKVIEELKSMLVPTR